MQLPAAIRELFRAHVSNHKVRSLEQSAAMITCHKNFLMARCQERGYSLAEVMPCVVDRSGDLWTIDTESEFYPLNPRPGRSSSGPGTELKALLAGFPFYITSSPTCSCNARARQMDEWGPDECERQMDVILGWMKEQATARKLPFIRPVVKFMVQRAIALSRKRSVTGQ